MSVLGHVSPLGWLALVIFAIQNGFAVLIMRWSKVMAPEPYSSQVAVLMQEVAVKLPISAGFYAFECGGALRAGRAIIDDLRSRPVEWAQLAVPAILYTIQNTLLYVGYANVEAAVGHHRVEEDGVAAHGLHPRAAVAVLLRARVRVRVRARVRVRIRVSL